MRGCLVISFKIIHLKYYEVSVPLLKLLLYMGIIVHDHP